MATYEIVIIDEDPQTPSTETWTLQCGDATREVVDRGDGRHLVEIPDDAIGKTWRLFADSTEMHQLIPGRLAVTGGVINVRRPDPIAAQVASRPFDSPFRPRVTAESLVQDWVSRQQWPPVTDVPVNELGLSYAVHYIAPTQPLLNGDAVAEGVLQEYETHWEPLGWALDEWVETATFAPGEDRAVSSAAITASGHMARMGDASTEESSTLEQKDVATIAEVMSSASRGSGSTRAVQIGVGRSGATTQTSSGINPVAALVNAVTGAFQFGASAATATSQVASAASLQRQITSGISQAAQRVTAAHAATRANSSTELQDTRELRALRNPRDDTTTNLALFSVARQWLVSTQHVRSYRVLLVPIHQLEKRFTAAEVFTHHDILEGALLDETVRAELGEAADAWSPESPPAAVVAPEARVVTKVKVTVRPSDLPEGRGSYLSVRVLFRADDDQGSVAYAADIQGYDLEVDAEFSAFTAEFSEPLRRFAGASVKFVNPGGVWDRNAVISFLEMTASIEAEDDTHHLARWTGIRLIANERVTLPAGLPRDEPAPIRTSEAAARPRSEVRVLAHLNTNRPYYRFAIDLQTDPVSRFAQLRRRFPTERRFDDMRPLGVVGTYLVLRRAESGRAAPTLAVDPTVDRDLVTTPTTATFIDTIPGAHRVDEATPPTKVGAWTFPAVSSPATLDASFLAAPASESHAPVTTPTTESELKAILEASTTSLVEAMLGVLDKARADAKTAADDATKAADDATVPAGGSQATDGAELEADESARVPGATTPAADGTT